MGDKSLVEKCTPHIIIVSKPEPKVIVAQQISRGQRGDVGFAVQAPLNLTTDNKLELKAFTYTQTTNLALWAINHNLNKPCPYVTIQDDFGETIIGDIRCIDNNNLEIRFNQGTTGIAYLI